MCIKIKENEYDCHIKNISQKSTILENVNFFFNVLTNVSFKIFLVAKQFNFPFHIILGYKVN